MHLDGGVAAQLQDVVTVEAPLTACSADGVADVVAVQACAIEAAHIPDLPAPLLRLPPQLHVVP